MGTSTHTTTPGFQFFCRWARRPYRVAAERGMWLEPAPGKAEEYDPFDHWAREGTQPQKPGGAPYLELASPGPDPWKDPEVLAHFYSRWGPLGLAPGVFTGLRMLRQETGGFVLALGWGLEFYAMGGAGGLPRRLSEISPWLLLGVEESGDPIDPLHLGVKFSLKRLDPRGPTPEQAERVAALFFTDGKLRIPGQEGFWDHYREPVSLARFATLRFRQAVGVTETVAMPDLALFAYPHLVKTGTVAWIAPTLEAATWLMLAFDQAGGAEYRICAYQKCRRLYIPARPHQEHCSESCARSAQQERYRGREDRKEKARKWQKQFRADRKLVKIMANKWTEQQIIAALKGRRKPETVRRWIAEAKGRAPS